MNPIELGEEIEKRYRSYLETTFYFKDPELRKSFHEALKTGHLSQGPYIESTPVFKTGTTPKELFNNILDITPDEGFLKALLDRPLYLHQEEAIKKAYYKQNIVVATGTGSGKTEAFLYPILLHLYHEFKNGTLDSGVRALILYPMNALANDQRERLRNLCKYLKNEKSEFHFTFGQYIGETPEDENDTIRHARDCQAEREQRDFCIYENKKIIHGELIFRREIREKPPHILLTNYSMLEYLLLRPEDSSLFDNNRAKEWTYIVLDEAHQYRGSRGIEMAMLLRRLKNRLKEGGCSRPLCCIATSATLIGEGKYRADVAHFAKELFDEPFNFDNIILGKTEPIVEIGDTTLSTYDYQELNNILELKDNTVNNRIDKIIKKYNIQIATQSNIRKTVGALLLHDTRASNLRRNINGKPQKVKELADLIFNDTPGEERISALSNIVQVLVQSEKPTTDTPLLSARYHLLLRSLEGAYVSYWPEKKVFLEKKSEDEGRHVFEIALCRECGQHYFVGQKDSREKIGEAIRDPSHYNFGASFYRPIENTWDKEKEEELNNNTSEYQLCIQCGAIGKKITKCGHNNSIRVIKENPPKDEDRADQIAKCGVCGYHASGHDPVQEVVHGTDGPHAVIATTLFQNLPVDRKKILAFADSRQQAAFFAWYLQDSYENILNRNLLLKVVRELSPHTKVGLSLHELSIGLRDIYQKNNIFPPSIGDLELRKETWCRIYHELLSDEPRISLEGVGLIQWLIKWPPWFEIPKILLDLPWSLSEQEAQDLVLSLLNFMRSDNAVELRTERAVSINWNDLNLIAPQQKVRIGPPKKQWNVQSWEGKTGKRARYLQEILMRKGLSEKEALDFAVETLRNIWENLRQLDETTLSQNRLLLYVDDARRLNPDWWRIRVLSDKDKIYQCNVCGRLQTISVNGICQRYRCKGTLNKIRIKDIPLDHYRQLYETDLPGSLVVEEHTAQLNYEKAREFQREFREDKINVLSCSTTFELGVDLGNLDTIFLRNVPPEAFNYTQRVGRAGRRSGYPGLAITYCRRSPHDLYHFAEPERILNGKIQPPTLNIINEKIITRHITATILSFYFRNYPERFATVQNLFKDFNNPSGVKDFYEFIQSHRNEFELKLRSIVPSIMYENIGINNGQWVNKISKKDEYATDVEESKFSLAEAEISSDYNNVLDIEEEAIKNRNYRIAEWARKRANTIANEKVLNFLSRKIVIPKYSFPVDVVELDTQKIQQYQEGLEILLQRDLSIAISEFAPTSKLVANKKLWSSYGLKKVAEKEWPIRSYKRCFIHNFFTQWEKGQPEPPTSCGCDLKVFEYIIPLFGFITDQEKPKEPTFRPTRVFTTRPYFSNFIGTSLGTIAIHGYNNSTLISMNKASKGQLTVLCEGRRGDGFYICEKCGAGFRRRPKNHRTPYGRDCYGTLKLVSLGHEFVTDVLKLQFLLKPDEEINPIWFAYSLAYALVEGAAEVLEVPSTDLSATVAHKEQYTISPIILYDNVPGGAGLVARLENEEIFRACLDSALNRVSGICKCDETTSCYGCLRSYRNQFAHQYLQRGPVKRYLEKLMLNL